MRSVDRLGALAVVGLVLLPLAIAGLLTWALSTPAQHLDRVTAAIVNDDVPVTLNGKTLPVGRQLAAGLIEQGGYDWVLTNDDEAAEGLAGGRYVAVVTIPTSFSASATSFSGPAQDAQQADIRVTTAPSSALLDPAFTQAITDAAVAAVNKQLIAQYLDQLLTGYSTLNQQIGQAAAGADEVAAGAASLAGGAQQLATGADQLSAGLQNVDAGAGALSDGLAELDSGVQDLPGQTAQLAKGSAAVAGGLDEVASGLDDAIAQLTAVQATVCASPGPACDGVTGALQRLQAQAPTVETLAGGADAVAAGNKTLAAGMPPLVDGIDSAAAGAAQLADGAGQAVGGAEALDTGSQSLASGADQVDTGAAQLSDGLTQAVAQIPAYSADDVGILSTVASQPVRADQLTPAPGMQAVPFFAAIALWIGAVVVAATRAAVPGAALLTAETSVSITRRAALPGAAIGALQGVVTAVAVLFAVQVDASAWVAFVVASAVVGLVFVVVNQGLAAAFGGVGRFVAVLVAVVALAVGLTSTVPPTVAGLSNLLPTAPGFGALLGALTGDTATARSAVVGLVLFGVLGVLLVLAGVAARRRSRARDLAGSVA
ncbi:YhgE/Pip domain-containing protein [Cellulomonas sp. P5_C6]